MEELLARSIWKSTKASEKASDQEVKIFAGLVLLTMDVVKDTTGVQDIIQFCVKLDFALSWQELGLDEPTVWRISKQLAGKIRKPYPVDANLLHMCFVKINMWAEKTKGTRSAATLAKELRAEKLPARQKLAQLKGRRIAFFGDSLMTTLHWGAHAGYPDIIAEYFKTVNPTMEIMNAGIGGHSTVNALKRIDRDIIQKKPATVFFMFGGNDFYCERNQTHGFTLAAFKRRTAKIIAELTKRKIQVIPMTLPPLPEFAGPKFASYSDKIRQVARSAQVPLVDIAVRTQTLAFDDFVACDHIHLYTDGQLWMARELLRWIAANL